MPNAPIPKNELPVNVLAKLKTGLTLWFCANISKSTLGIGTYKPKRTSSKRHKIFVIFAFKRNIVSDCSTR